VESERREESVRVELEEGGEEQGARSDE